MIGIRGAIFWGVFLWAAIAASDASASRQAARSADEFVDSVGVNVHLAYTNTPYFQEFEKIEAALVKLGVRHVRDNVVFKHDVYDKGPVVGRWWSLGNHGIKITLIADANRPPADLAALANRARGAIEAIEGPNEYDLSPYSDWVTRVRSYQVGLFGAVKALKLDVPILAPSLGNPEHFKTLGDLSSFADWGNIHSYPGGGAPTDELARHRAESKWVAGGKPVVATETGYHTALKTKGNHAAVTFLAEGKYTPRLLFAYFNAGIHRTFLYQLHDQTANADNSDREAHFGLLAYDFTPKPAYRAVMNCLTLLKDPGPAFEPGVLDYNLKGDTAAIRTTLLQKRDGRFYLALWQEKSSYDRRDQRDIQNPDQPVTLILPKAAARARLFRPGAGLEPVTTWGATGEIRLVVPDEVILVELDFKP